MCFIHADTIPVLLMSVCFGMLLLGSDQTYPEGISQHLQLYVPQHPPHPLAYHLQQCPPAQQFHYSSLPKYFQLVTQIMIIHCIPFRFDRLPSTLNPVLCVEIGTTTVTHRKLSTLCYSEDILSSAVGRRLYPENCHHVYLHPCLQFCKVFKCQFFVFIQ